MAKDYGIKVSRSGVDVKTATIDDLIFTSKYPSWKVKEKGTGVVTVSSGNTIGYTETAHSLTYRPFVIGFSEPDTGSGRRLLMCGRTPAVGTDPRKFLHTDATNFTAIIEKAPAPSSDEDFNFTYYVMVDQNAA